MENNLIERRPTPAPVGSVLRIPMLTPKSTQMSPIMLDLPPVVSIPTTAKSKKRFRNDRVASSNLAEKLAGDVAIGTGVTFTIVPFLTVVDKAIVQSAAGTHTMLGSAAESFATMVRQPVAYVRSPFFLLMWATYAATYSTANSLKTITEHYENNKTNHRSDASSASSGGDSGSSGTRSKFAVFLGTSVVNSGASLMKDRAYARMFGTSGAAASVPMMTLGLWASRDFLVVGSSFVLPDMMRQHLVEEYDMKKSDAQTISQLTLPVAAQFLAGPIQLLGLDIYNRPLSNLSISQAIVERTRFLAKGFSSIVSARIVRIAPGYGVGGVLNTHMRDAWRDRLHHREVVRQLEQQERRSTDYNHLLRTLYHHRRNTAAHMA